MENKNIFMGRLVRLTAEEPEVFTETFTRWDRDSEYRRLLDDEFARIWSPKKNMQWFQEELENPKEDMFFFQMRTLDGDRHIGFIGLFDFAWNHGEAMVGIGIGERPFWGKGYGTDAMQVILRYAFTELNLWRVSLDVFEYNPRAIRSYEKAGFVVEGRCRRYIQREGRRWDIIYMSLLKEEWERLNGRSS